MAGPTPPDPAYVEQLSAVVRALVDLLSAYGYASEADWLQARLPEISEADKTPEGVADIQGKLHRVIPGMGASPTSSCAANPTKPRRKRTRSSAASRSCSGS